jgi:hypothetical protein
MVRIEWIEGCFMERDAGKGWMEGMHPDDVQGCFDGFLSALHV